MAKSCVDYTAEQKAQWELAQAALIDFSGTTQTGLGSHNAKEKQGVG